MNSVEIDYEVRIAPIPATLEPVYESPRCAGCDNEIDWVITRNDSANVIRALDLRCLICGAPLRWPADTERI